MEKAKSDGGKFLEAKRCLQDTLVRSKLLASEIDKAALKLIDSGSDCSGCSSGGGGGSRSSKSVFSGRTRKSSLSLVSGYVTRAYGSIGAVIRACESVSELERLLIMEDLGVDVVSYLSLIKQQEEVLKFLCENCGFAVKWMEDVVKIVGDDKVVGELDGQYLVNVETSLRILKELRAMAAHALVDGGVLRESFDKLEIEFGRLCRDLESVDIEKLHEVIEILKAKNRLGNCQAIYVEMRSLTVKASFDTLDLSYLDIEVSESESIQNMANHIALWGEHMEFALKKALPVEYELCRSVFDKFGLDISMGCFAEITTRSGFLRFLKFSDGVAKARKDAAKLLKLLDIFTILDRLRLDFNKLFGGKACQEIKDLTRDVVKRVVTGACQIFLELSLQVEIQGSKVTCNPFDGGVPRSMSILMNYCITLLREDYRPVLSQVLSIYQHWNNSDSHDGILKNEFFRILEAIERNLETWSKAFNDITFSHFFMMNNYKYLHGLLEATALGDLLGEEQLCKFGQKTEYYAAAYLKGSWRMVPATLTEEGSMSFFPDEASTEESVKTRLTEFNNVLEDIYKRQTQWFLMDHELREKAQELTVNAVIPAYSRFLDSHAKLLRRGSDSRKHVKYSINRLEAMLKSLFIPKRAKSDSKHGSRRLSPGQERVGEYKLYNSSKINAGKGMWIPCC